MQLPAEEGNEQLAPVVFEVIRGAWRVEEDELVVGDKPPGLQEQSDRKLVPVRELDPRRVELDQLPGV